MERASENVESIVVKNSVRVPPKRGQIKAMIITQFVKAGKAMFSMEKSHSSQLKDDSTRA